MLIITTTSLQLWWCNQACEHLVGNHLPQLCLDIIKSHIPKDKNKKLNIVDALHLSTHNVGPKNVAIITVLQKYD